MFLMLYFNNVIEMAERENKGYLLLPLLKLVDHSKCN